jgi:hypothetical protein
MLWDIKDAFVGKSKEHEQEDEAIRRAHFVRVQKLQDEAMQQARDQRDYQRKLAVDRLKEARDVEDKTALALNAAFNELNNSNYQLAEAKTNLEKAKGELELLSNKEIELVNFDPSPTSNSRVDKRSERHYGYSRQLHQEPR